MRIGIPIKVFYYSVLGVGLPQLLLITIIFFHYVMLLAHYFIQTQDIESLERCVTNNFACEMLVDKTAPGSAIVKECGLSRNNSLDLRIVKHNEKFKTILEKVH